MLRFFQSGNRSIHNLTQRSTNWNQRVQVDEYLSTHDLTQRSTNGRKIFEGDIVKGVAYSTDFIGYIVWIDAIAGFGVRYFNKHREPTAWENSSILKAIQRWKHPNEFQAEIIGNIFDNPELIN